MLPEVRTYISYIENAKAPSKAVRMPEVAKLKAIKKQLEEGLAGTKILSDSCNRILTASTAQRPVDVKKEVPPATSEEVQQAAQSAVQAAVQGAVEKATSEIQKQQEAAEQKLKAEQEAAEQKLKAEQEAAEQKLKAEQEAAATKIQRAMRKRQESAKAAQQLQAKQESVPPPPQSEFTFKDEESEKNWALRAVKRDIAARKIQEAMRKRQAAKASQQLQRSSSGETEASQAETAPMSGPSSPEASKPKPVPTEVKTGLTQSLPTASKPSALASLTESAPAALPTQEPKASPQAVGLAKTVPVEPKPATSVIQPLTSSAPASLPSQSGEPVGPELTESTKCPSQDITITEKTCDKSEAAKRILKTLLSPEANVECEDKGKAAAEKLAEFIRLCEKSTAEAAAPEEPKLPVLPSAPTTVPVVQKPEPRTVLPRLPSAPTTVPVVPKQEPEPEPRTVLPRLPSAPTTVPAAPTTVPAAPTTVPAAPTAIDEKGCPIVRVQVGDWMCALRGDELKAMLERLSAESNPSCPDIAKQKYEEFEEACPAAIASLTEETKEEPSGPSPTTTDEPEDVDEPEEEGKPEDVGQVDEPSSVSETGEVGVGTEAPEADLGSSDAGVSTSMQTIPKDGYNEVHIVVKIPSNYQQVATGTTGTTYATAIQSLTQGKAGGAKRHRAPVTPKRRNRNNGKLLYKKSLKRR
jgi:hypothetical protein